MMNILIAEDDSLQLAALKEIVNKYNSDWHIFSTCSSVEAKDILSTQNINIFMLDIEFDNCPAYDGLSLAQDIRHIPAYHNTPILFITAYKDKVYKAVNDIHCYGFITKPYVEESIHHTLRDLDTATPHVPAKVTIRDKNGIYYNIVLTDIIYIESYKHGTLYHTVNGNFHYCRHSLTTALDELDDSFIQIHKKYIINKNYINNYDKTKLLVQIQNTPLPVGRSYKPSVDDKIG